MQLARKPQEDGRPPTAWAWYVGEELWTPSWLPGVTVPTASAVASVELAESLSREPESSDPIWPSIHLWARQLGLTTREAAAFLRVDCPIPDPTTSIGRKSRLWIPKR